MSGRHRYAALDAISAASGPSTSSRSSLRSLLAGGSSRRTITLVVVCVGGLLLVFAVFHGVDAQNLTLGASTTVKGRYGAARAYADMLSTNLRYRDPQSAFSTQMQDGKAYLTGMLFGGQSNQLLALINLLFIGKELERTVILPPLTAIHFKGQHRPFHLVYDLPRFYALTQVPAVPMSLLKSPNDPDNVEERVTCWSLMEKYTGACNAHAIETGLEEHKLYTDFWAVPPFKRSTEGAVLEVGPIVDFLANHTAQLEWIETTRREVLPQKALPKGVDPGTIDPEDNVKQFFDPLHGIPPTEDDQLMCLDATFYVGDSVPPPPYPQRVPLDPWRVGRAWKEIGQHLHWVPEIEEYADAYLMRMFSVKRADDVPPFISVHVRRGDFKDFHGNTFTPLSSYMAAVEDVRKQLQGRLDHPPSATERQGRPPVRRFSVPPRDYAVVATTDEGPGSELYRELAKLGWQVVDHDAMRTVELLGEWYPSNLDGEILSRGQGFVGTQWSTFSMLSGNRVEYWRGGIQIVADPKRA